MSDTLDDYRWLTSDAAVPFLRRCAAFSGELHALTVSLRKELSATRTHLVLEQVELRRRAREKFSRAEEMFFTRKGFEQATDEAIAAYKASRLLADVERVADLCCGIGGDLLALAKGRVALGVDLDPVALLFAEENCRRLLGEVPRVLCADVEQVDLAEYAVIHADPDRRADGQRHTRLVDLRPGVELFTELRASHALAWKLAPATVMEEDFADDAEREWIGSRGECRQQMLWTGALARHPGLRTATVIAPAHTPRTVVEQPGAVLALTEQPRRYLYEPHAATLAAQVVPSLASEHNLLSLLADGGYLTGDQPLTDPALASFEILDVLPFDLKQLRAYFRARNIGRLEIKKRGVNESPESLRQKLQLSGDSEATLILLRSTERTLALIARRA